MVLTRVDAEGPARNHPHPERLLFCLGTLTGALDQPGSCLGQGRPGQPPRASSPERSSSRVRPVDKPHHGGDAPAALRSRQDAGPSPAACRGMACAGPLPGGRRTAYANGVRTCWSCRSAAQRRGHHELRDAAAREGQAMQCWEYLTRTLATTGAKRLQDRLAELGGTGGTWWPCCPRRAARRRASTPTSSSARRPSRRSSRWRARTLPRMEEPSALFRRRPGGVTASNFGSGQPRGRWGKGGKAGVDGAQRRRRAPGLPGAGATGAAP